MLRVDASTENKGEYGQLNSDEDKGLPQEELSRIRNSETNRCLTKTECAEVGYQILNKGSVGLAISRGIMSVINDNISCSTDQNRQKEIFTTTACVSVLMLIGLYSSRKIIKENRMKLAKEARLHLNSEVARRSAVEAKMTLVEMMEQSQRQHEEQKLIIERQRQEMLERDKNRKVICISELKDQNLRSFKEKDQERAQNMRLFKEEYPEAESYTIDLSKPDNPENSSCCQG